MGMLDLPFTLAKYLQKSANRSGRIWRSFIRAVTIIRGLLCYERAYRDQFRRIIWQFAQDGIIYAEIRVALNYCFAIMTDDAKRRYTRREILQLFADVLAEELPKMKNEGFTFYGIKIIYACMRSSSREAMKWCMDNCIEMKQIFPDLICGKLITNLLGVMDSICVISGAEMSCMQALICRGKKTPVTHYPTGSRRS